MTTQCAECKDTGWYTGSWERDPCKSCLRGAAIRGEAPKSLKSMPVAMSIKLPEAQYLGNYHMPSEPEAILPPSGLVTVRVGSGSNINVFASAEEAAEAKALWDAVKRMEASGASWSVPKQGPEYWVDAYCESGNHNQNEGDTLSEALGKFAARGEPLR